MSLLRWWYSIYSGIVETCVKSMFEQNVLCRCRRYCRRFCGRCLLLLVGASFSNTRHSLTLWFDCLANPRVKATHENRDKAGAICFTDLIPHVCPTPGTSPAARSTIAQMMTGAHLPLRLRRRRTTSTRCSLQSKQFLRHIAKHRHQIVASRFPPRAPEGFPRSSFFVGQPARVTETFASWRCWRQISLANKSLEAKTS